MNVDAAHEFREAARLRGLPRLPTAAKVDLEQDIGAICRAALRRARIVKVYSVDAAD